MYQVQTWNNNDEATPLEAGRLRHIEDGIEAASYVAEVGAALGARVVTVGDSITIGAETHSATVDALANSWPAWAGWLSNQRINVVKNAGKSGDRSDQMLARWDTDVVPYAPTLVILSAGTNDINQGVDPAVLRANVLEMIDRTRDLGAKPVLVTVTPRSNVASYGAAIVAHNAWLRQIAQGENVPLLDYYDLVVDRATGALAAAYDTDGTHPNTVARKLFGQRVVDALAPLLPPSNVLLPLSNSEPGNLITNNLFLTDSNADGRADGWAAVGGGAQTPTLVAATVGNWQQWEVTEGTAVGMNRSAATGWSVGEKIRYVGKFSTTGAGFQVQMAATGASYQVRPVTLVDQAVAEGTWSIDFVIPSGTTNLSLNITGGVGTHKVAQVGVYNLTRLGLD